MQIKRSEIRWLINHHPEQCPELIRRMADTGAVVVDDENNQLVMVLGIGIMRLL